MSGQADLRLFMTDWNIYIHILRDEIRQHTPQSTHIPTMLDNKWLPHVCQKIMS